MMKPEIIKLYFVLFGVVAVCAIIGVGIYEYRKPPHGTWRIGVCRVFAELYIRFPQTLRIEKADEKPTFAEITLNHLNAHGSRPTQVFRCDFMQQGEAILVSEIRIDREKIDQEYIDRFNIVLPYLIEHPDLNTELPKDVDDNDFASYKR